MSGVHVNISIVRIKKRDKEDKTLKWMGADKMSKNKEIKIFSFYWNEGKERKQEDKDKFK